MFVAASVTGAVALAVIFGAHHPGAIALVAVAAGIGGWARRLLGARGQGMIGQAFAAAAIAGVAGALATHLDLSGPARLVAVCPAMILVPGPHILNGAIDLGHARITQGLARLTYATLILGGISAGLVAGLAIGGADLPPDAPLGSTRLWLDVPAAAVAAASYPVYFSLPLRLTIWPVLAGAVAHALRWALINEAAVNAPTADLLACLVAGLLLAPVARRAHAPFAGVGFAAVVALLPGVYVFRFAAGLVDLAADPTAATLLSVGANASAATLTTLAIVVGLVTGRTLAHRLIDAPRHPDSDPALPARRDR